MLVIPVVLLTPTISSEHLKYYKERLVDSVEVGIWVLPILHVEFPFSIELELVGKQLHPNNSVGKYEGK